MLRQAEIHEKLWGEEQWLANREYCGKLLKLKSGYACSIHYHKIKTESFYLLDGEITLWLDDQVYFMMPGDIIDILPYQKHRFLGRSDATILEISTHHEEDDSYRTENSMYFGRWHRYGFIIHVLQKFCNLEDKYIIDCACGKCDGSNALVKQKAKVLGIDIDPKQISDRNKNNYPDLTLTTGNICALTNIENESADIFVCSETLEHLTPDETVLAVQQINRVVKPGGYICVTTPSDENICLSKRNVIKNGHKQYLTMDNIEQYFSENICLFKDVFYETLKIDGGNNVVLFQKIKSQI